MTTLIVENEKDFFEDFTTLRWVKWTTRQPDWNGSVYVRWHSKYTSNGIVHNGYLMSLNGENTKYTASKKSGKISIKYTANQKRLLEEMYWLEEIHDIEGYILLLLNINAVISGYLKCSNSKWFNIFVVIVMIIFYHIIIWKNLP